MEEKKSFRTDIPLSPFLSLCGEMDERADNVFIMDVLGDDSKTTAEDCGDYWHIRDWEIREKMTHWFCRSGYVVSKKMVDALKAMQ